MSLLTKVITTVFGSKSEKDLKELNPYIEEVNSIFIDLSSLSDEELKIKFDNHKKEIVIMHPGPLNRGVEIDSSIADSDQAIILDQVLNGVAVRMSILYLLLGSEEEVKA